MSRLTRSRSTVLKGDGTAISKRQQDGFWGKGLMASKLDPGDTVVTEKLERVF